MKASRKGGLRKGGTKHRNSSQQNEKKRKREEAYLTQNNLGKYQDHNDLNYGGMDWRRGGLFNKNKEEEAHAKGISPR